ncbi:MAG: hypothetical protein NT019_02500 [Candidatus Adlerbacteria bacterium]|nr:hypothetical protein [Candidatus Adlerbacteria bacterium]
MDEDIEELKELVKKNLQMTEDTHRIVRGMRSSARWGRFFSIVWWLVVLAVSGATYYIYVQPYVQQVENAYTNGKNFETQVQDFFKNFGQKFTQ